MRTVYRISLQVLKKFIKDECFYKASCLSFYSLLSIVPIFAVAFGIAKGVGFEKYLIIEIKSRLFKQPELAEQIISFAYSMLKRTHGGVIAVIGVVGFLWTSIQLFNTMEHMFNSVWGIKEDRSYQKQALDYLIMLFFGPLFLVGTSMLSFVASSLFLLRIASPVFIWILFFFNLCVCAK